MHGHTAAFCGPACPDVGRVGAKEVSPARKGWDCATNLPERRLALTKACPEVRREGRRDTTRGRIAFRINPIGSPSKVLTNKYLYATIGCFYWSRPLGLGRLGLESPR